MCVLSFGKSSKRWESINPSCIFSVRLLVSLKEFHEYATLWLFNIAMENGPFIDGLPIKNGWIFPWLCES